MPTCDSITMFPDINLHLEVSDVIASTKHSTCDHGDINGIIHDFECYKLAKKLKVVYKQYHRTIKKTLLQFLDHECYGYSMDEIFDEIIEKYEPNHFIEQLNIYRISYNTNISLTKDILYKMSNEKIVSSILYP